MPNGVLTMFFNGELGRGRIAVGASRRKKGVRMKKAKTVRGSIWDWIMGSGWTNLGSNG